MERVSVQGGKLVLPDGMNYGVLVLPAAKAMTPALAEKIHQLAAAGATIVVTGPAPKTSPSLAGFPQCDEAVAKTAAEIWGDCDGKAVTEHAVGQGRVIWGQPLDEVLGKLGAPADFAADAKLNWIHRRADGAEIYFVANPTPMNVEAKCHFRVTGLVPELWNPQTGEMSVLPVGEAAAAGVSLPLHLEPSGSVFVVFRQRATGDSVVSFTHDGKPVFATSSPVAMQIQKATYGVPGDATRTRDVRAKLQALVDAGVKNLEVAELARGDDPAYGVVKTLTVEFTLNGQSGKITGQDPDTVSLNPLQPASERVAEIGGDTNGQWQLKARQQGRFELKTAQGRILHAEIKAVPAPQPITGSWDVSFPPKWGAPEKIVLDTLTSWSDSNVEGVKYFSGTATYTKTFKWKPAAAQRKQKIETWLELGEVHAMARVKLNGHDLGVLWQPPFRVNVTAALKSGGNTLEVQVANLWPNRLIGDAALAETNRLTWSSWQPFKPGTPLLKSGLLGPVQIVNLVSQPL